MNFRKANHSTENSGNFLKLCEFTFCFLFKASSLGHDHGEVSISRKDDGDEYSKMDQYFSLESCLLSVGTINTSRWCICLFCVGWLRNVQRFIMRAEPLYESLNPLSSDVFAAVVQFPKSEPFNRKFRKFRDENQMERKLPGKKNSKIWVYLRRLSSFPKIM